MKTPEEIKRALKCANVCNDSGFRCKYCPYCGGNCPDLLSDALAYIQKLEAQRDAAVKDLGVTRDCRVCKHFGHKAYEEPCASCGMRQPHWEWRGVKEDTHEQ